MRDTRLPLYVVATLTTVFAGLMIGSGASARETALGITQYLGPAFSVIFAVIILWGLIAFGWLRQGQRTRAEAHMRLVVSQAREMGLVGTFVGILALLAPLSAVDLGTPDGIAIAMPGIVDGLSLALGTTLAGRLIANVFLVVWTLTDEARGEVERAPATEPGPEPA